MPRGGIRFFMSPRLHFMPRDEPFFEMFNRSATNTVEAAMRLVELMDSCDHIDRTTRRLKDIEHASDDITQALFAALARSFITPIDRDDIGMLATSLDDVVDCIEETAQ